MIVGISGKRGSGKTTLGNILDKKYGFQPISFANRLKEMTKVLFSLSEEHVNGILKETELVSYPGFTPRQIMIDIGQFFRRFDRDFWVKIAFRGMDVANYNYVVTDVRFPNEADHIKRLGGKLVRLNRSTDLNIYKGDIIDISETALDDYNGFDLQIPSDKNQDIKDLERTADEVRKLC